MCLGEESFPWASLRLCTSNLLDTVVLDCFWNICGKNGLADNRNCVSLKKRVAFIHQIRLMNDQIRWPEFLPILPTQFPPGTLLITPWKCDKTIPTLWLPLVALGWESVSLDWTRTACSEFNSVQVQQGFSPSTVLAMLSLGSCRNGYPDHLWVFYSSHENPAKSLWAK